MKNNPLIPIIAFGLMALAGIFAYEHRSDLHWPPWSHNAPSPSPAPAPATNPDDTVRASLAEFFSQAGDKWNAHTYTVAASQKQWSTDQQQALFTAAHSLVADDMKPLADACTTTTTDAQGQQHRTWNPNATEESIGAACKAVAANLKD
jgi:hypothetical protein